jgi:tetratricopeptide (TPR) repeat protein
VSAQRRKQKRLILMTLLTVFLAVGVWQVYAYIASAPQRAEALVQDGIRNLGPNRYPQAIQQFTDALSINANSWNAYYQRAVANQGLGKLDAALEDYQAALQLNPNLVEAATARAAIFADKGDVKRSVVELTKVIDLKPNVEAHYRRGDSYAALKQYDKAVEDFTWVIEQVRDAPYVYFARANAKRAMGDLAGAVEDERIADTFDRGKTLH